MKRIALLIVLVAFASVQSLQAAPLLIGHFGEPAASGPIVTAGHTPVQINNLGTFDFSTIDVLWIFEPSNGSYNAQISANAAAISAFVSGGGVLSFHDRRVVEAASVLPGAGGVTFVRDTNGTNPGSTGIDVVTATTLVTNGPGGVVNDATLDGGSHSNHGFATIGTLPAGAVAIFDTGVDGNIVDFYYPFGNGFVYYSTIPLDFYLPGASNFAAIYAPNEAAFQAFLAQPVPEPASLALWSVLGLTGGFGAWRRRKANVA